MANEKPFFVFGLRQANKTEIQIHIQIHVGSNVRTISDALPSIEVPCSEQLYNQIAEEFFANNNVVGTSTTSQSVMHDVRSRLTPAINFPGRRDRLIVPTAAYIG